jgi:TrpR-related protein YerC/YecD
MKKECNLDQLIKAIIAIDNKEECREFLNDLCTYQELEKLVQRLEAAQLLYEGKTYFYKTS